MICRSPVVLATLRRPASSRQQRDRLWLVLEPRAAPSFVWCLGGIVVLHEKLRSGSMVRRLFKPKPKISPLCRSLRTSRPVEFLVALAFRRDPSTGGTGKAPWRGNSCLLLFVVLLGTSWKHKRAATRCYEQLLRGYNREVQKMPPASNASRHDQTGLTMLAGV